jgi:hypothetical protein
LKLDGKKHGLNTAIKRMKYKLRFGRWWIALYYEPMGSDKKDPLLLIRKIWSFGNYGELK